MSQDRNKMMLGLEDARNVQKVHRAAVGELLEVEKPRANVVGIGVGVKWTGGEPTGEPALVALVTHKVPADALSATDMVRPKLQGVL